MITYKVLTPLSGWSELVSFHNLLFKHADASAQWFDWYMTGVGGQLGANHFTRAYLALDGDVVVGSWCVEPKRFQAKNKQLMVGRCFAVGTHPSYRRQNLFVGLSKHAIEEERKLALYDHIVGFPQADKPVVGGHIKSGWTIVQQLRVYDTLAQNTGVELSDVQKVLKFGDLFSSIDQCGFIEGPRYRNMRWKCHPNHEYVCLHDGDSYVVIKPYAGSCHVLDVNGERSAVLLQAIRTLAYRHRWEKINLWCADNDVILPAVQHNGFIDTNTRINLMSVQINSNKALELDQCHLPMGVEEMF